MPYGDLKLLKYNLFGNNVIFSVVKDTRKIKHNKLEHKWQFYVTGTMLYNDLWIKYCLPSLAFSDGNSESSITKHDTYR